MKKLIIFLCLMLFASSVMAFDRGYNPKPKPIGPYRDHRSTNYRHYKEMFKDSNRDGVMRNFDYHNRNLYIQGPYQKNYYGDGCYKHKKIYRYYGR